MIRPRAVVSTVLFCSAILNASITTTTALTSVMPAAPVFGQAVTLIATVSPATAPGSVSFLDEGVLVGTGTVSAGVAQATTFTLSAATHSLVAVYGGNILAGYLPSQSAAKPYIATSIPGDGFASAVTYAAGRSPFAVAIGDFNRDGKVDLVVANEMSTFVSVLLGNGNGTFQTAVNYTSGPGAISVAVGDFNGDSKLDLVVENGGLSNTVSVLLGNGDGTFQTAVYYSVGGGGGGAGSLAVGDFNGDGNADLVMSNQSGSVSVLLGIGDGTFPAPMSYPAGIEPNSVTVGDFNGDGKPDLVVAGPEVNVLLGNGDGTFQTPLNFAAGSYPYCVAVGDFNGDGKPDLVVANEAGGNVSVLLGNGNGTFQQAVNYATGMNPFFVAVGDFNGDGVADLVVPNVNSANVSVLLGNGDGTFRVPLNYAVLSPYSVAVGDFNGDGREDLAVASTYDYGFANDVSILLALPTPSTSISIVSSVNPSTFGQPVTLTATVVPSNAPGVVEFLDGTTVVDSKTLASGQAQITTSLLPSGANPLRAIYSGVPGLWQPSQSNTVHQVVNPVAASGFTGPVNFGTGTNPTSVAVGDFNADGKADLAVANSGGGSVSVLLGNGNGTFQTAMNFPAGTEPISVAVGDFNADGVADLVVADHSANRAVVLLGNGNGTFQAGLNSGAGNGPTSVAVADFNGDTKADVAVADFLGNDVSVLLGKGNGTFQAAVDYPVGNEPVCVAAGDFNRDGFADLVVANLTSNSVSVLLGNGNGTFQTAVNYFAGSNPESVAVGDFNGDGKPDLAVANFSGTVSVLLGNGDGTFQTAIGDTIGTNLGSIAVTAGDFNGDGTLDLAVANESANNVSVLLGNGNGTFQTAVNLAAGSTPFSVAAGDFNGDGKGDLAVAAVGGGVHILLGTAAALQFFPLAPCRIADTRTSQPFTGAFGPPALAAYSNRAFPMLSSGCSIPAAAQAYSLNFTVVPSGPLGFLSAWPAGSPFPGVSTLNSTDGSVIANAAIVPAGTSGGITVVAGNPTDLVIDINGYFAPPGASSLEFFPLTPCRIADTRTTQPFTGAFGPPSLNAYVTRDFPIATSPCLSGSEQAYSLNMTVVPPGPVGFLSAWPVGQSYPGVSTLNSPDGIAIANAAIVPAGTHGDIDVVVGNPTDVVIDINGKFATPGAGGLQFYALTPCRVADTRTSQPFTGAFGPPSLAAYASRDFPIQSSPCGIPLSARAYALNMTVVPQGALGFLSTWPAGQAYPGVSTLNSPSGEIIANAAIVPAGTSGAITVVTGNPTDLIIDVVGYFAP